LIPETTRDELIAAMARFDREYRDAPEWEHWESRLQAHKYAIEHEGGRYPVKFTISLATGQPVAAFSGGDEANSFVKRYGFNLVPLRWSPNRTSDGMAQILDVLRRLRQSPPVNQAALSEARAAAIRATASTFEVLEGTVSTKLVPGLGFADRLELDAALADWLFNGNSSALRARLEQHVSTWNTAPDLEAIADFFIAVDTPQPSAFWWVNQGSTYQQEKAGAYIWAPQRGTNGVVFGHWTNVSRTKVGDVILHYANNHILAVSRVAESPRHAIKPAELPTDSWEQDGHLARVSTYQELEPPIRRVDIPSEWRTEETGGPFTQDGNVKQGYLFPLSVEFVRKLASRFLQLGTIPGVPKVETSAVWLFQANPNYYNLANEVQRMGVGTEDDWSVTRYKDRIQPRDIAILWQGGSEAGIYAIADIISLPFQRTDVGEWMVKRDGAGAKPDMGVRYRITRILNPPIPKAALQLHPVLKDLMVIRAPTGTNFAVSNEQWAAIQELIGESIAPPPDYVEPSFHQIRTAIDAQGLRLSERVIRRYHSSLRPRGFVILSGISGGGKTRLTRAYANAVGAEYLLVPVAPNWNSNEDLLGFYNPVHKVYVDTRFSHFLRRAAREFQQATEAGRAPRPFHLVLDEMNLARVEHYFAKFLSAMELRGSDDAVIDLHNEMVPLTPNLIFVGTVNVDETTHGFANKVYDRAQLIEVEAPRELLEAHLQGRPYQAVLLEVWDNLHEVAPFAFRVLDDIELYVHHAGLQGIPWRDALDDQLLQKVLPKLGGADDKVGACLDWLATRAKNEFPLTAAKAERMASRCHASGFASYF
jgi:hypothetical protein